MTAKAQAILVLGLTAFFAGPPFFFGWLDPMQSAVAAVYCAGGAGAMAILMNEMGKIFHVERTRP